MQIPERDAIPAQQPLGSGELSVISCKVTNGFRCDWGAETYAAFRSVVSTAKANGASVPRAIQCVLSTKLPLLLDPG
jgi:hypothetical protein